VGVGATIVQSPSPNINKFTITPQVSGQNTMLVIVSDGCQIATSQLIFTSKQYNYAFISPVAHDGAFGGLSGVDDLCQSWAASAGIPGTYRAILSTSTANASTRLGSARGWIRPDKRPVGDLPSDIFENFGSKGLLAPVQIAADGTDMGAKYVWSASFNDGSYNTEIGSADCSGWTDSSASLYAWYGFSHTTSEWLDRGTVSDCSQSLHVYCFQVDYTTPLVVSDFAENGRVIFVSNNAFDVTSGLAGADAICTADAASNPALNGKTFLAFLAGDGTTAASRFTNTSTPIVRVDGLRVADNFEALTTADLVHPVSIRANGSTETWRVFTGASNPTTAGSSTTTCTGWTSTDGDATEGFAESTKVNDSERQWFGNTSGPCSDHTNTVSVYCLEPIGPVCSNGIASGSETCGYSAQCTTDTPTCSLCECILSGSSELNGNVGGNGTGQNFDADDDWAGDFYFLFQSEAFRFWANNIGMQGLVDMGVTSGSLQDVVVPTSGYDQQGVLTVAGHTYVSKANSMEPNFYIIFRVTSLDTENFLVNIEWVYLKR